MTRDQALAHAAAHRIDPDTLTPLPHSELETDAGNGGYAFTDTEGRVVIAGYDGSFGTFALYAARPTADSVIEHWLDDRRHANRILVLRDLGVWQQAAVAAVQDGITVAELGLGLDAEDTDYAEYLRILLARHAVDPVRTLAANDHLLGEPEDRRYTHPCALCGQPAVHADRYPRSVCDSCYAKTVDSTGRRVTGANVGFSGGFVAHFADTGEVSTEVTATKRCWVEGHACSIDEAHLGGVVVQAL
jgi:hypothetical protein